MTQCILFGFNGDWMNRLRAVLPEDATIQSFDRLPDLTAHLKIAQPDLICWSLLDGQTPQEEILQYLSQQRYLLLGMRYAANVFFSEDRTWENRCIEEGAEHYIVLPEQQESARAYLHNAITHKHLLRSIREQMWISFGYQSAALSDAMFVFEIDISTGTVTLMTASPDTEQIFYPIEYYTDFNQNKSYFYPDDYPLICETIRPENMAALSEKQEDLVVQFRALDRSGHWEWVETKLHFVKDAYGARRCFAYTILIDEEMQEKETYKRIMQEDLDAVVSLNAASGQCRFLHLRGQALPASCTREEMLTILRENRMVPQTQKELESQIEPAKLQAELQRQDSLSYRMDCTITPDEPSYKRMRVLYADKRHLNIVLTVRDVTAAYMEGKRNSQKLEQALAQARKASHAKSDFLSRMSHDIRTPMNAIIGMNDIAQHENKDPVVAERLKKIDTASRFLLGLINDILDLSKIESGEFELRPSNAQLATLDEGIDTIIRPLMAARKINFRYEMNCGLTCAWVDSMRFQQIFFNLLTNAAKFTPEGGEVLFSAHCLKKTEQGERVRFLIKDNGIGMSEQFQAHALEPFQQENGDDGSFGGQWQGTGLGLSIVKKLVEMMHGELTITSVKGGGTTITVDLDLIAGVPTDRPEDSVEAIMDKMRGKRILLAEDNHINTEIARRMLEQDGILVDCAENGRDAVEQFRNAPVGAYSAILMDVRMPIMDGLAATKEIRALPRADAAAVPIIAMSANSFDENGQVCLDAGMNLQLTKPIEGKNLYRALGKFCSA